MKLSEERIKEIKNNIKGLDNIPLFDELFTEIKELRSILEAVKKYTHNHSDTIVETCGDCLSDGRGTCGEQLEQEIYLYERDVKG